MTYQPHAAFQGPWSLAYRPIRGTVPIARLAIARPGAYPYSRPRNRAAQVSASPSGSGARCRPISHGPRYVSRRRWRPVSGCGESAASSRPGSFPGPQAPAGLRCDSVSARDPAAGQSRQRPDDPESREVKPILRWRTYTRLRRCTVTRPQRRSRPHLADRRAVNDHFRFGVRVAALPGSPPRAAPNQRERCSADPCVNVSGRAVNRARCSQSSPPPTRRAAGLTSPGSRPAPVALRPASIRLSSDGRTGRYVGWGRAVGRATCARCRQVLEVVAHQRDDVRLRELAGAPKRDASSR
jgi:hypothetical protein